MEQRELLFLTILQGMGGQLSTHLDKRFARALLSQFSGHEINPDELKHILDVSEEDGFIEIDQDPKNIRINREGATLLSFAKDENQTKIINSLIRSYQEKNDQEKEPFVNEILDAVTKETQYFEKRVQDFSEFESAYATNGFLATIRFSKNVDWLSFSCSAYAGEQEFTGKLRCADKIVKAFESAHCAVKLRETSVDIILFDSYDWKEKIDETGFEVIQEKINVDPAN